MGIGLHAESNRCHTEMRVSMLLHTIHENISVIPLYANMKLSFFRPKRA